MIKVIKLIAPKLIQSVELFDHYVGKNIPSDQQSVAFRIIFQHQSRTLTDAEVMKIVKKIVSQLKNKFKVKLRGKV
jgi:phenylalanyl-tRNA synthetase beta chain